VTAHLGRTIVRTRSRNRLQNERGAALVEFALTLPLMLLLLVGIMDFGMAFQRYNALNNAAREGARMAVLPGYAVADVQERVSAYLTAAGVSGTPTTTATLGIITPASGPAFGAWTVTVTMDYPFPFLGPIGRLVSSDFATVTMRSTAVMRAEIVAGG
jgi:Flp pilus assembly protein TadG